MYKETNKASWLTIIIYILCLHVVVSLPGKFIPVSRPSNTQSLTQDEMISIKRLRELLARGGARAEQPHLELTVGDLDTKTDISDSTETDVGDETIETLKKKRKKMKREWKKFKKWRRRKKRKKKMRNKIIQMITTKLEEKLEAAGGKLNEKNLKKIFDII